jgi:hypothetical protein
MSPRLLISNMNDFDRASVGRVLHTVFQTLRHLSHGGIVVYPVLLDNVAKKVVFILREDLRTVGVARCTTDALLAIYRYLHFGVSPSPTAKMTVFLTA